ncbi:hypothetical protein [Halomontanus rarus]
MGVAPDCPDVTAFAPAVSGSGSKSESESENENWRRRTTERRQ